MDLPFYKYQGAGNDFILVDNRDGTVRLDTEQIAHLCHRRFGIGADGLMLLQGAEAADFEMIYYNADGHQSTMCGNGGRCIAALAHRLGVAGKEMSFMAIDGSHQATILEDGRVALHMQDVNGIRREEGYAVLDTGSPHYVCWVDDLEHTDVFREGREIRNREEFAPGGINVNFIRKTEEGIAIRTYERGVEDETLACGTGVTAAAIVAAGEASGAFNIAVNAMGGPLSVAFRKEPGIVTDIVLTGGAEFVFSGIISL